MDIGNSYIDSSVEQEGYCYISGVALATHSPTSKGGTENLSKKSRKKRGDRETNKTMNTESMNSYLIAIAQDRDRTAFEKLFAAFAPKVKSFAMRNGVGPELAEEVVQETFVRVWRKAEQFDPRKASASTWLYTIARNQRIDLLRKRHRPEPDFEDPAFIPEPEPQPADVIVRNQEASRLRECISALSPEQQEVLKLSFMEELPHGEVAEKLGIPLGTVKSRIRLAMKHIKSEIGDIR